MKNVLKKVISILLVSVMTLGFAPFASVAELELPLYNDIVGLTADAEQSDYTLTFNTKFYTCNESGEWCETFYAEPGEAVKARLYINTNYAASSGQIYMFFSNDFFEHDYSYSERNIVNFNLSATSSASINMVSGNMSLFDSSNIRYELMMNDGYLPLDYAEKYHVFALTYRFGTNKCNYISGEEWFVEFDLRVRNNVAHGMYGEFFINPDLIYTPDRSDMYFGINIPVGTLGGSGLSATSLNNILVNYECNSSVINLKDDSGSELPDVDFIWSFDEATGTLSINSTRESIDWSYFYSSPLAEIKDSIEIIVFEEEISPVKEGYTFIGWQPSFPDNLVVSDVTLTEVFNINSYEVKWIIDEYETTEIYEYGSKIIVPTNPEKDGYYFIGWTPTIPSGMPAKNMTFTAKFVDYDVNKINITIVMPESRVIRYGESIKLYANTTNLPSGSKIKWRVEGEGVSINPSASGNTCTVTSTLTGNVVIYAYVVDSKGNIVCDSNGKQIFDCEYFYSEATLWLRIVYFFKKLFHINLTTTQLFEHII